MAQVAVANDAFQRRLRGLAVSGPKRAGFAPELPTVAEAALPGFQMTGWYAYLAPAKTPAPVGELLNREFVRALNAPDLRERLAGAGSDPVTNTPAEFAAFIRAEVAMWAKVIRDAKISVE